MWKLLRPKQWTKNLILFAGLIFSGRLMQGGLLGRATLAFVVFCLASSCIYVINDILDVEADRLHPEKRHRPIASGAVSLSQAWALALILGTTAIAGSSMVGIWAFSWQLTAYIGLMILYSLYLKRLMLLDAIIIACGFVLRTWAGTTAVGVAISPWLLVCTVCLALFLAFAKRRHELTLLEQAAGEHRPILRDYTPQFLDQVISIVTTATIIAYSLYAFSAGAQTALMLTIPFVLYGMFRYLFLVQCRNGGGAPELVLLSDRPLIIDIGLWGVTSLFLLYIFPMI